VVCGLAAIVLGVGCERDGPRPDQQVPAVQQGGVQDAQEPERYAQQEHEGAWQYVLDPPAPQWLRVRVEAEEGIVERVHMRIDDPQELGRIAGDDLVMYEVPAIQPVRSPMQLPTDTVPYTASLTVAHPRNLEGAVFRVFCISDGRERPLYEAAFVRSE